jgi:hypothetical protein
MASSHVQALQTKHDGLDRQIHQELRRPHPNDAQIADLKRQKLRIKDEISTG